MVLFGATRVLWRIEWRGEVVVSSRIMLMKWWSHRFLLVSFQKDKRKLAEGNPFCRLRLFLSPASLSTGPTGRGRCMTTEARSWWRFYEKTRNETEGSVFPRTSPSGGRRTGKERAKLEEGWTDQRSPPRRTLFLPSRRRAVLTPRQRNPLEVVQPTVP